MEPASGVRYSEVINMVTLKDPPVIRQTILGGQWHIITSSKEDKDRKMATANKKYPIPDNVLQQIAYWWFLEKELGDDKKGYVLRGVGKPDGPQYDITVKRIEKGSD